MIQLAFGKAVKSLRTEQGMTQEDLAFRTGLHRTYISDIERGSRNISLKSISVIAKALGVSLPNLMEATMKHFPDDAGS
jgi:transcriptional regulator with XRE-family HTH domain